MILSPALALNLSEKSASKAYLSLVVSWMAAEK